MLILNLLGHRGTPPMGLCDGQYHMALQGAEGCHHQWSWSQAWVQLPSLPLTTCVPLGKSLKLFGPPNPPMPLQACETILTAGQWDFHCCRPPPTTAG